MLIGTRLLYGILSYPGACPGGGQGACPLEIEKQKKVIRANFKLFHLHFSTFLVGNTF